MKVLKIYLFNCPNTYETQIYCIKLENGEDLTSLKEKVFLRCPLLKNLSYEPQIYWFDLENDRIMITCDDDLRFFLEECTVTKLIFDYGLVHEGSRKRHLVDEEGSEASKKIRRKLQQIVIENDSDTNLSMDTDDSQEKEEDKILNSVSTTEEPVASTSQESPKIKIIDVEIINPGSAIQNENIATAEERTEQVAAQAEKSEEQKKRKTSTNKIVISDSSDDEEDTSRNRRHSEGNYSSSYSFSNSERFDSRRSFDDDFRRSHRQFFGNRFRFPQQDPNLTRIYENARNVMRNAQNMRDHTLNQANNMFPQILSTFQAHFRPLFQPTSFSTRQQYTRTYRQ